MKQRLCTLVYNCSKELSSLLDTIGIWYETDAILSPTVQNYSLIIINGEIIDKRALSVIKHFSTNGGSILQLGKKPQFFHVKTKKSYIKRFVFSDKDSEFFKTRCVDLYDKATFSITDLNSYSLFNFEENVNNGFNGFLGIDPDSVLKNSRYTRKRFPKAPGLLPDEIVSEVSRDSLTDILEASIQKMFHHQNLPFIKKWSSPSKKPIFAFRIDTDYGDQKSLDKIFNLLEANELTATWFLHVKAHEEWLQFFEKFKAANHELALHGYKHATGSSFHKISKNIHFGLNKLKESNIEPKGYAAPYAIWNDGLVNILKDSDFEYSSEFTRAYDSLPFFDECNHLQIPIHPVCTGSFSRLRYSLKDVERYFKTILNDKLSLWKPVFFYHHPLQYGLEVFESIFKEAVQKELCNLTFLEFARFWKKRNKTSFSVTIENQKIQLHSDANLLFYISNKPNEFELINSAHNILTTDFNSSFKYDTSSLPSANEIDELSNNKLRLMKTSLIDWKNRVRL